MSVVSAAYLALVIMIFVGFGAGLFAVQMYSNAAKPRTRASKVRQRAAPARGDPSSAQWLEQLNSNPSLN